MDGLDLVCRNLFGVRLCHVTPEPGEVWSSDIHKLVTCRVFTNNSLVSASCNRCVFIGA